MLFNIDGYYLASACSVPSVVLVDCHIFSHPYWMGIMISQINIHIHKGKVIFKDHILESKKSRI